MELLFVFAWRKPEDIHAKSTRLLGQRVGHPECRELEKSKEERAGHPPFGVCAGVIGVSDDGRGLLGSSFLDRFQLRQSLFLSIFW